MGESNPKEEMKFEEWFLKNFAPKPHPEETFNSIWIDADILIAILNKVEPKIKDREELLSRRLSFCFGMCLGSYRFQIIRICGAHHNTPFQ
jgi:hypothetical protein